MAPPTPGAAPTAPLNAMEVGATTLLGERASLVDPAVKELGKLLLQDGALAAARGSEIEVEVRIGVLAWPGPFGEVNRLDLPCGSEAILRPAEGFGYRFLPGLPEESFNDLLNQLDRMSNEKAPKDRYVECGIRASHTVDKIYKDTRDEKSPSIRATYSKQAGNKLVKTCVKGCRLSQLIIGRQQGACGAGTASKGKRVFNSLISFFETFRPSD
eukprot:TRINITY_DN13827_c0_g1_i2.p1 TRINITY_DN13827_c0_g1~~TRINITY_DN13827_c0_g1_i2.p1  ORF type:complete len:214 (-),score=31.61 TRINITY_DN13827_c0_g1_i2:1-642(-)